jgi:hypothetical protein
MTSTILFRTLAAALFILAAPTLLAEGREHRAGPTPEARQLSVTTKAWKGDFDGMLERRAVRIYVYYAAYKLVREAEESAAALKEQVAPARR